MNAVELLDLKLKCGESPLWFAEEKALVLTDACDKKVLRVELSRSAISDVTLCEAWLTACVCHHADGGLVLAGAQGLRHLSAKGDLTPIAVDGYGDAGPAVNDAYVDARGRMIGGAEHFREHEEYAPGPLLCIRNENDQVASADVLDDGYHLANGVGTSPDGRTLYATDSARRTVFSYEYDIETGRVDQRRALHTFAVQEGIPDGLAVDEQGFVWCAMFWGGCVVRMDPQGQIVERIALPVSQVTSLCFGGDDLCDLFITTAGEPVSSRLAPPNARALPAGGALFHTRAGVRGLLPHLCRLPLDRHAQRNVK